MRSAFLNRIDTTNVGDRLASPLPYFRQTFPGAYHFDVHRPATRRKIVSRQLQIRKLIIGGGGLVGRSFFREDLRFFTSTGYPTVLWGAGHNSDQADHFRSVHVNPPTEEEYNQLSLFTLVGVRDWGTPYRWVPCPSCLHQYFDVAPSASSRRCCKTLIALHDETISDRLHFKAIIAQAKYLGLDFEVVLNVGSFQRLIAAIISSSCVVTNSFHCAYWSVLLQRPVIAIGGGSKIFRFRHRVPDAPVHSWRDALQEARVYKDALEECRQANVDFAAKVEAL